MKKFLKMTAATTMSRTLKIQFEFFRRNAGCSRKKKCTYFHLFIHTQYTRVKKDNSAYHDSLNVYVNFQKFYFLF